MFASDDEQLIEPRAVIGYVWPSARLMERSLKLQPTKNFANEFLDELVNSRP